MFLKREVFFVMGLSRSGTAAAEFLLGRGCKIYIYDDVESDKIQKNRSELTALGATDVNAESLDEAVRDSSVLVLSPGIPIDNPVAVEFKKQGKRILGESELAALFVRALAVGVTGTNGKTTTVSMISEILKRGGVNGVACGNIGVPYITLAPLSEEDVAVVEVSSFQLETLHSFRPHIAVLLNVTPDHLNRHYNMENYLFLKGKILKNLTESEYAVLNADDENCRGFGEKTKAKVKYFSINGRVDGAYLEGTDISYCGELITSVDELFVTGKHNVLNALAAVCVCKILGVENSVIKAALKEFKGVRHRMEIVDTVNGITYIDDSKATNVDATKKAVESVKGNTVLMLGGKDKGYDYTPLFEFMKNSGVVHTVIYGENRFKLLSCAVNAGYNRITLCEKFQMAFKISNMMSGEGYTVLLSPASASFDEFCSFEERGERFIELVKSLKTERDEVVEEKELEIS